MGSQWDKFEAKMKLADLSGAAMDAFKHNYDQLIAGATGLVPEDSIDAITSLPSLESLQRDSEENISSLLSKTAVLKLNGGLGTSMGLETAKSLLPVKNGKTFLDLIAEQIKYTRTTFGSRVRFILMNSFSTSKDTRDFLAKKHPDLLEEPDVELLQNSSCKVDAETLGPVSYPENPDMEWAPPGHGDIYPSLVGSGMLERLLDQGIEYVFVSNSDNLGATLDLELLSHFAKTNCAFLMEVCKRTKGDKKGGHLAKRKSDGRLMLRESAMCPEDDKATFEDITVHKYFNTNNLWLNLKNLKSTLESSGGTLKLPLIKNKKTVNPRDPTTASVFQLETAMGSAIECFDSASAIEVPRTRFAPVKTSSDLFALRSDAYTISDASTIVLAAAKPPFVKLDDRYYKLVDKMESYTRSYPSLIECTSLIVKGPVIFESGVSVRGDVTLINNKDVAVELHSRTLEDIEVEL
eukprot:jgi/Picsp_1/4374/NSC_01880-R1_utp--glucose-1-phosphate uridylyltransferase